MLLHLSHRLDHAVGLDHMYFTQMSNNPKAVCQELLTQINIERAQCSQLHLRLEWCQVGRSRALDILPLPREQTTHQGCLSMKFKAAFSDQGLGSLCKGEPAHCLHGTVHLCCRETLFASSSESLQACCQRWTSLARPASYCWGHKMSTLCRHPRTLMECASQPAGPQCVSHASLIQCSAS